MTTPEIIAQRLKLRRQELGLSQAQLADMVGASQQLIGQYEAAKGARSKTPSLALAAKLATALDVSLDWLAGVDADTPEGFPTLGAVARSLTMAMVQAEIYPGFPDSLQRSDRHLALALEKGLQQVGFLHTNDPRLAGFLANATAISRLHASGSLDTDAFITVMFSLASKLDNYRLPPIRKEGEPDNGQHSQEED